MDIISNKTYKCMRSPFTSGHGTQQHVYPVGSEPGIAFPLLKKIHVKLLTESVNTKSGKQVQDYWNINFYLGSKIKR